MAVELVLTLGQAFEVAYQLAVLKNGASEVSDGGVHSNNTSPPPPTPDQGRRHPAANSSKPIPSAVVATNSSTVTVGIH